MQTAIRKIILAIAVLLIAYAASWLVVYSVVMEFDYEFVAEYFVLGWRGGGELPTFIQAASVIGALLIALLVWAWLAYTGPRRHHVA